MKKAKGKFPDARI